MNLIKKILLYVLVLSIFLPAIASASFDTSLKLGSKGSPVVELQNFLQKEGFLKGVADGKFGTGTKKAVIAFQLANGLKGDGSFGPTARAKAKMLSANSASSSQTSSNGSTQTNSSSNNSTVSTTSTPNVPFSGTLDLIQDTTYLGQTLMAPQTNLKLAQFTLKNNTTESIQVNNIETDLFINSTQGTASSYVKNLYITYGNNTNAILNKTTSLGVLSYSDHIPVNFIIPVGQKVFLSVYGDVNSSIPIGTILNANLIASGVSLASSTNVYTNADTIQSGQNITFNTGSLTVSASSSTSTTSTVLSNQLVDAGDFQFTGTADSYTISQLKFIIPGLSNTSSISSVVLEDTVSKAKIATTQITNDSSQNNSVFSFLANISVPVNSPRLLSVYYNLSSNINSNSTNINISPVLIYVKALNSAGTVIDGAASNYTDAFSIYGGIAIPSSGVTVNSLSMFKSIPTITSIPTTNTSTKDGSNIDLYKFSIKANPNGNISVKQLTFAISFSDPSVSNPYLNNFELIKGNTNYTSDVAIGNIINNNFVGLSGDSGVGAGSTSTVVVNFPNEEIIGAGTVQTYTLRADINSLAAADSVSVSLSSNGTLINGGSYLKTDFSKFYDGLVQANTDSATINYYNFLWSDMSESFPNPHNNFNGNYTNDWYNGYGVPGSFSSNTINAQ